VLVGIVVSCERFHDDMVEHTRGCLIGAGGDIGTLQTRVDMRKAEYERDVNPLLRRRSCDWERCHGFPLFYYR
jgi:hypothetical protein